MKIEQIELPDLLGAATVILTYLAEDDSVYVMYWPSKILIEKYGCPPEPKMRPLSKIWKDAVEKERTEMIVFNILNGHSAVVRVK